MPEKYTYLLVDFFCIIFPLIFSFVPRFAFYKQWRFFALPCLITALFFVAWDIVFTRLGIWSFNERYIIGWNWGGLPLEEYLFFICIPYACTFTYHCLSLFIKVPATNAWRVVTLVLIGGLLIEGLLHAAQLYTSVTFLSLAVVLQFLQLRKVRYLPVFYLSFLIILIPFFLSNGVLTGGFIGRIVVSYNNAYNLGIRLYTIPVEDIFYGMLLLLMNVAGYERLKQQAVNSK